MDKNYRTFGLVSALIFLMLSAYFIPNIIFYYIINDPPLYILTSIGSNTLFIAGIILIPLSGIMAFLFTSYENLKKEIYSPIELGNIKRPSIVNQGENDGEKERLDINQELAQIMKKKDVSKAEKIKLCFYRINQFVNAVGSILYTRYEIGGKTLFKPVYRYMTSTPEEEKSIEVGEGIIGEVVYQEKSRIIWDIPGDKLKLKSGLGQAVPQALVIVPIFSNNKNCVDAVWECAFFSPVGTGITNTMEETIKNFTKHTGLLNVKDKSEKKENR